MTVRTAILILVVSTASVAHAGIRDIRISWSQPDTATTMTVSWNSDSVDDPSRVQYGYVAPGQFEAEGEVIYVGGDLDAVHVVELTELKPDTVYQYRVGEEGNWSEIHDFRTGHEDLCKPVKFVALGDNRPDADWLPQLKWNPILEEAVNSGPEFLLHSGDIVKDGEAINQWADFLDNSEPYLSSIPMMATIGNHDDGPVDGDGANYNRLFAFPRNSVTNTEDYYYFVYGNAIYVSLSSQTYMGGDIPFGDQAAWLDEVLTENPMKWKFVFLHHPPYTSHRVFDLIFTEFEFNHPPNEKNQNPALVPIFDKHHVDIVFAGHNHYYERFKPLYMGADPAEGELAGSFGNGTVYVVTGGGGAMVYDEFEIPWGQIEINLVDWVCGKANGSDNCAGDHHFVSVEIDDGYLKYEAWATSQQTVTFDPDFTQLIDSFEIYKNPSVECLEPPVEPVVEMVEYVEIEADVISQEDVIAWEVIETAPEVIGVDASEDKSGGGDAGEIAVEMTSAETMQSEDAEVSGAVVPAAGPPSDSGCGCQTFNRSPVALGGPLALLLVLIVLWSATRRRNRI